MKIVVRFLLNFLFFGSLHQICEAQDCKYLVNKTDPISSLVNKVVEIEVSEVTMRKLTTGAYLSSQSPTNPKRQSDELIVTLERKGDNYFIKYSIVRRGRSLNRILPTDTTYFKLENGNTIKLVPNPTGPEFTPFDNTVFNVVLQVTKQVFTELSKSRLRFVRLGVQDLPTLTLSEKQAEKFFTAVACLLN